MKGFGIQPAGTTPAGLGAPEEVPPYEPTLFRDRKTGKSLSGRYIDPGTRRYLMDASGRTFGMSIGQQGVHLAVTVALGTSAVTSLGNRLKSIKTFGVNYQRQLDSVITEALSRLIQGGQIALVSVEAKRFGSSGAYLHIRWRDLSDGQLHTTDVRS